MIVKEWHFVRGWGVDLGMLPGAVALERRWFGKIFCCESEGIWKNFLSGKHGDLEKFPVAEAWGDLEKFPVADAWGDLETFPVAKAWRIWKNSLLRKRGGGCRLLYCCEGGGGMRMRFCGGSGGVSVKN